MTNIDLLHKKLEGRLTEEEDAEFQSWLQESEENFQFFRKMEVLWKEGKAYHLYQKIDIEAAWEQVLQKEKATQHSQSPALTLPKHTLFPRYRLAVAAAIALLIGTVAMFYYLDFYAKEVHIQTAFGEKISFVLPDQSEVVLNANSRLSYKKNQPRKVWLEGEAFFQISKKPLTNEKFQVITRDLEVEVLGTAFNVNSHQEQTKVYLEEGSIKLDLQDEVTTEVLLVPGEILTYSAKKGAAFKKIQLKPNLESSWKAGIQLFDRAPLSEILNKMEDIYGISIVLKNKELIGLEITMGIPVENLDIALETLENVLGLKMTQITSTNFVLE